MIIIKGEIKTSEIIFYKYNRDTKKVDVKFNNGKVYSYIYSNIECLKNPIVLNINLYRIFIEKRELTDINAIYVFEGKSELYWHICFENGSEKDYLKRNLHIVESCLSKAKALNVFSYIKQLAGLSDIKNVETGEKLLLKRLEAISFISNDIVLSKYLNPSLLNKARIKEEYIPIFPFGCNNSQYIAVKNAMENQISVIQGPPGTGKTQTILNIIANILIQGKTVQIVSNNNSATENIYEKLSSPKYNLGFIVAILGNSENKKNFTKNQNIKYPLFDDWKIEENRSDLNAAILENSIQLKTIFDKQEKLSCLKQELSQLEVEYKYFELYLNETNIDIENLNIANKILSKNWMNIWQECQLLAKSNKKIGLLFKIKNLLKYGLRDFSIYNNDISKVITIFQQMYYKSRKEELCKEIEDTQKYLDSQDSNIADILSNQSMDVLKDYLAQKYGNQTEHTIFSEEDLWRNSYKILEEYPVILSTTFSSRNSLNSNIVYDYLIMDEASQVDIVTGCLALSCAKNAIIVGDTKQLPNVVTEDIKTRANSIFESFNLDRGYEYTKIFLQSVLEVLPNVEQILLKEHYRCHPKIIDFCNQKFYKGELIIMTEDRKENDTLSVIKTVVGNHERDHYSQRQIDIIKNEIIPKYSLDKDNIGIITPYKNQVEALMKEIKEIDIATVHKFQGKEKDTIIISTVDDEISDFTDDPYLLNVAVSRAKKRLILVITGNEQQKESNIKDLVNYIQYNNFEVKDSKVYSVFDYLYKQYTKERMNYLQKYKKISEFDSENLMYSLLENIISDNKYMFLDVVCHFPLNMLIRDPYLLDEEECKYAMNPATHIDFLLYNRISKKALLGIEVDGYIYHKEDTIQAARDRLKDKIMRLYEIPLLRFNTNGSNEKEIIINMLDTLI